MKLRNKKTGKITDLSKNGFLKSDNDGHIIVYQEGTLKYYVYNSIGELNEEWEDGEGTSVPSIPLIKDKEIRDIIRTWMLVNGVSELTYIADENSLQDIFRNSISFNAVLDLKDGEQYTIAELCGEEEE